MKEERGEVSEPLLRGAVVQRVDLAPAVAVLRVRAPGATRHVVIAAEARGAAVGVLQGKPFRSVGLPGGSAPLAEKLRLRSKLEGARIEAIEERRIVVRALEARLAVEIATRGEGPRIVLRDVGDEALAEGFAREGDEETWRARGEALAGALGEGALTEARRELGRALSRAKARIERRITAIRGDLGRIGEAEALAARAASFVAEAARAPRGATSLTVTDWSSGEPREVSLALDPARPAREQIEAMFKRARRLKLGATIGRQRLAEAEAAEAGIAAAIEALPLATSAEATQRLAAEARRAAPRDFAFAAGAGAGTGKGNAASARKASPSRAYRVFHGAAGERIFVGKGAANNDALSFHTARPHDLWLHAKGRAGAHVIVPLDKKQTCPAELLIDAAHLAAHFSEAREEGVVEIEHTPRRYLRKPRGSAPGFVIVDREKVIVLRVERERTARLLAAEEP